MESQSEASRILISLKFKKVEEKDDWEWYDSIAVCRFSKKPIVTIMLYFSQTVGIPGTYNRESFIGPIIGNIEPMTRFLDYNYPGWNGY